MVFAIPEMPLTVPTQISLISKRSVAKLHEHIRRRSERCLVDRIGAVKLPMVETDNVNRGSRVWQICLEQASQTTEHKIGLSREIAIGDGVVQ
jgi:hypothetical protein